MVWLRTSMSDNKGASDGRRASDGKHEPGGKQAPDGKQEPGGKQEPDGERGQRERPTRLGVRKTYKLFIGGAFPRSESGRSYAVRAADGTLLAYAAQGSRKDARDAVVAARKAFAGWSGATAYNRGQILYRVAEMLEGRAAQFAAEVAAADGSHPAAAATEVAATIDRWVWYAGWSDKVAQVAGAANPVAGPYFNFSVPEPTGVVAIIAPAESSLLGLVSVVAPVIVTGNTAVVVASEKFPLPAISLAEVLATSDLPAGVVNVLTGRTAELAPVLAGHMDVNAMDLTGIDAPARATLQQLAAGNVKRVTYGNEAWAAQPGTQRLMSFLEIKTVWHPAGT
jgi:acyl-CoA reductase-like NAD-dependent aldehyde dehydrogenase